ncbi:MAG: hypothetical protein M0P13_04065 [Fibrobacteraceae bacterium]|nr:hypothetical protein [Fibrobacteraceae bacterium]
MKRLIFGSLICAFALTACSNVTLLRTKEMKAVGNDVKEEVTASAEASQAKIDSLSKIIDSLGIVQKRMKTELSMLSSKLADVSEKSDSHQEELLYRLDMLLGKSDKILSKKVVVNGLAVSLPADKDSVSQEKLQILDSLFTTARSDYHRGEFKLAYSGFKQVYEEAKTGTLASDALYWMGVCLVDASQVEKAKVVFNREITQFPDAPRTCSALFKLSSLAESENNVALQKQYLQKILSTKSCTDSNEFLQAAEILETILNSGTSTEPHPAKVPDSSSLQK